MFGLLFKVEADDETSCLTDSSTFSIGRLVAIRGCRRLSITPLVALWRTMPTGGGEAVVAAVAVEAGVVGEQKNP
jgi:hypothetical protein